MIRVNDLSGTVTMSLEDYEFMRDRENEAQLILDFERLNFKKEKLKFDEGFIRKVISTQDYTYDYRGNVTYPIRTETLYLPKEDALSKMEADLVKKLTEGTKLIRDLKMMSVRSFKNWRSE